MRPTRAEAEKLLKEAEACNPGPWGNHSRVAAMCAERIAARCTDLDPDKAYVLGLLHDIGRRTGVRYLGHVADGYSAMMAAGYDEVARVCLTHSFDHMQLTDYIGRQDTTQAETDMIRWLLSHTELDEYDRLIQLCDAMAGSEGVLTIEERMLDVKRRYGHYPQTKWENTVWLKQHFEEKMGCGLYDAVQDGEKERGAP